MSSVDSTIRRRNRGGSLSARVRRSQISGGGSFNPTSGVNWSNVYWGNDPAWANPGNGNPVSSWRDGRGSANLVQGTGANQPIFTASSASFNNRSTLTFDGTNDMMATAAFGAAIADPQSVVMIGRQTALIGGTQRNWWDGIVAGNRASFAEAAVSGAVSIVGTSGTATGQTFPADTTSKFLRGFFKSGTGLGTFTFDLNTAANTGLDLGSRTLTGLTVGSTFSAANFAAIEVAFVGVYAGDVTTDNGWTNFINWARTYYTLSI